MTASLLVFGHLAVMDRLAVPGSPETVGSGRAGTALLASLTADAPLVALDLAARGHSVTGFFSHPGPGQDGAAAMDLLDCGLAECRFGPDCGRPLELQLLFATGEVVWYSDPLPGVRSLQALPLPPARRLYLDDYGWLAPALPTQIDRPDCAVFINLGRVGAGAAADAVSRWRRHIAGPLEVQAAISTDRLDACQSLAEAMVTAGCDLAVVTGGAVGLAVALPRGAAALPAAAPCPFVDASGAGAAVSAAVIDARIGEPAATHEHLAAVAVVAGRQRCETDGPLDRLSADRWARCLAHSKLRKTDVFRREMSP